MTLWRPWDSPTSKCCTSRIISAPTGWTRAIPRPGENNSATDYEMDPDWRDCSDYCRCILGAKRRQFPRQWQGPEQGRARTGFQTAAAWRTTVTAFVLPRKGRAARFLGDLVCAVPRRNSAFRPDAAAIRQPRIADYRRLDGRQPRPGAAVLSANAHELSSRHGQREDRGRIRRRSGFAHRVSDRSRGADLQKAHRSHERHRLRARNHDASCQFGKMK